MSMGITLGRKRSGVLLAAVLLGALFLLYSLFQSRLLLSGPQLSVSQMSVVQHSRSIELSGVAYNISAISVNGRPIVTDRDGNFTEKVILENGHTLVSVSARDRYGRTVDVEQNFVYTPPENLSFNQ